MSKCVECGRFPQADCWSVCMPCLQDALEQGRSMADYKVRP